MVTRHGAELAAVLLVNSLAAPLALVIEIPSAHFVPQQAVAATELFPLAAPLAVAALVAGTEQLDIHNHTPDCNPHYIDTLILKLDL